MKDADKLLLCGFLDLFSVSAFITTFPTYIKSYNVSNTFIGFFFSLYGALQILSSYAMGYLADKSDQKSVLCVCTALSAIGYLLLGLAPSFILIFLFRFITGLFKQTQTLSRTILSTMDVSNNVRVTNLGRFSSFSSLGFIFGPPIGGYIHENYGFFYVGCLASFGFLIMFFIFVTLEDPSKPKCKHRETHLESKSLNATTENSDRKKTDKNESQNQDLESDNFSLIFKTWDILASIFLLSFCPLIFRTNYSITMKERFQSSGTLSGFATSFGAITGSIAGILAPYVIGLYHSYYQDDNINVKKDNYKSNNAATMLLFHTSLILGFSILGCGLAPTMFMFVLFQSPVSFVNNISREGFNVVISGRVMKNQVGRVMGMNGSLIAFGRLIAPIIGGMMQEFSYQMTAYFGSLCSFLAAGIIYKFFMVVPSSVCHID